MRDATEHIFDDVRPATDQPEIVRRWIDCISDRSKESHVIGGLHQTANTGRANLFTPCEFLIRRKKHNRGALTVTAKSAKEIQATEARKMKIQQPAIELQIGAHQEFFCRSKSSGLEPS